MHAFTKIFTKLPDSPGVYLFYNDTKEIIYVGKATSLKDRVKSYFLNGAKTFRPIEQMLHEVIDIKWIATDSVLEAIILEGEYIKKYQPKYNVEWKDDKSWNYIVITKDEYPQVKTVRQHEYVKLKNQKTKKLKAIFGPYPGLNTGAMMKLLQKLFYFSTCSPTRNLPKGDKPNQKRPCLYRQMGHCLGICTGEISPKEYRAQVIRPLVLFLGGKKKQVVKNLESRMKNLAKQKEYEDAGQLRDQIHRLQRIQDIALLNKSFVSDQGTVNSKHGTIVVRVEGYDISNLGPTGVVGSMVVFTNGEADKSQYRKFKIRTVAGQSDVDALAEVLERRLRHAYHTDTRMYADDANHADKDYWPLPDLFLIDGGKPQVNCAKKVLREAKVSVPIVGIAKGPERKRNDILIDIKEIKDIGEKSKRELIRWVDQHRALLIRVRDEAHRFAISYQRKLRKI